ncbi:hypothetical protein EDD85DRAFT_798547 [Armillaria nabsnona]|nr:hypothetical protein EDD85DRAFT_798547 [Armillaria nabsnona]
MNLDRARTTPRDTRSQADTPMANFFLLLQPSTDAYPGGGVILQYQDGLNRVIDQIYHPYDPAAMMQHWGPHLVNQLYSGVDIGPTGFFDILANVQQYQVSWDFSIHNISQYQDMRSQGGAGSRKVDTFLWP